MPPAPPTPPSPRLLKGGLVLLDPTTSAVVRVIALQYNPDTLTRTLQAQTAGASDAERTEPMRFKGPPVETLKLDAEIDATDQLEKADANAELYGILPQLAALEALVYPTSDQLLATNRLADSGTLEIAPIQAPLCLFVWSERRIVPVRVSDFSITEEAFDPSLNPIRAKVSLGLRVLSVTDLGFGNKGGDLYLEYQRQKEKAARLSAATFDALGLRSAP
jgi:hypothetical protein